MKKKTELLYRGSSVHSRAEFALRQQLKRYLQKERLTARALALKTNVPYTTLANWLEGRMPRNVDQLKRVADFFGTSVDGLCYGTNEHLGQKAILQDGFVGVFEVRLKEILRS